MSLKKWAGATVAAFLIVVATNWFVHGYLLRSQYERIVLTFRPFEVIRARMWMVLVGELLFSIAFVYVYARGLERKPWLGQGIRYGAVIWLMTVVPAALAEFVTFYIPHRLALDWIAAGLVQLLIAGLAVAAIVGNPEGAG
jgi:hypothetical protein